MSEQDPAPEQSSDQDGSERESFAFRLRAALGGRSGSWLASRIDAAPQSVNAWLRGESDPALSRVVAVAEALEVSVQWLATGEEPSSEARGLAAEGADPSQREMDRLILPLVVDGLRSIASLLEKRGEAFVQEKDLTFLLSLRDRMEALEQGIKEAHREELAKLLRKAEENRLAAQVSALERREKR